MEQCISMERRLFLIGNGFDLAHRLPTNFNPDFKNIAMKDTNYKSFWELYLSDSEIDIWSDFENLLANPDFNNLEEIFEGYTPDYLSDHESDRDSIITQVGLYGNLQKNLVDFAANAENEIEFSKAIKEYTNKFDSNDFFINFNGVTQ